MKKILLLGLLVMLAAGAAPVDKDAEIRVYNIANMLWAPRDYPFESGITMPPTMPPTRGDAMSQRGSRGGGGGGGGGNPLFGGAAKAAGVDPQEEMAKKVVELIIETVDPKSWVQNGGTFTARYFAGMLIVNQTKANHEAIAQLLSQVRSEGSKLVTVKAHWVLLGPQELETLVIKGERKKAPGTQEIDAAALGKLGEKTVHYRAQTSCFNGQTVHVSSGRARTAVTRVQAVIGNNTGLYNPETEIVQSGAMLQITPMLSQDGKEAVVDLQSVVCEWDTPPAPTEIRTPTTRPTSEMLDRMNVLVQQLRTTVPVPVGKPVLVGGMTFEPSIKGGNSPQMYLIIEVSAGN
jgi:hypothetical protein